MELYNTVIPSGCEGGANHQSLDGYEWGENIYFSDEAHVKGPLVMLLCFEQFPPPY